MIKKLTQEQIDKFDYYVKKWTNIGLDTSPINKQLAEEALKRSYKCGGLSEPKMIFWAQSPCQAIYMKLFLKELFENKTFQKIFDKLDWSQVESQVESQVRSQVRSQVWSQVGSQVWSQVESQVWSQVESQVGSQVGSQVWSQVLSQVGSQVESQVWSQVRSQVWSQVGSQVWSQVESQVWSQVRSQVGSQVESQVGSQVLSQVESQVWSQVRSQEINNFIYGQNDASWLAFYDFMNVEFNLKKQTEQLLGLFDLAHHSNWVLPYNDIAIMSEKPIKIFMKDGLLHNETGPAIEYADGFKIYSLNGERLASPTKPMILAEILNEL